ncbi:MAG TPA: LexA family transcriptional regulator [Flavisolibacter sp.]|jgi:phage repressor protein C with HTH and peptisase S24 domain|nr:LexA family transcriptional regulator [Flavisolibacter sp.]
MFTSENLLEIRELANLSQTDFARKLGISREVVNKMECGKMKPSKKTFSKVQSFLRDHHNTTNYGDVNILGKSSQSEEKKVFGKSFHLQRLQEKNSTHIFQVPLVGIKAQAGYIKGFEQVDYMDTLEQYSLPPGVNPIGAVWRYFEIDGDSMEPTLSPGDVVLATLVPVEDWNDTKNFCVYVIHMADRLLIKRLYNKSDSEWVLISDNEDVAPQVLLKKEEVKEVWFLRRHIRNKVPQPKEFKVTA